MITNGYATLADFKQYAIPEGTADVADDSVIDAIIESVSRVIDNQTCRHFYKDATDSVQYFTASESFELEIPDLVSVTTLQTDDGGLRTYGWTWAAKDFDLWPYNAAAEGIPYRRIDVSPASNYVFPANTAKGVKVTGKFGWPAVPTSIKLACLIASKSIYRSRFGENETAAATVTASGVVITPRDFPSEAWTLISPYRLRR